ncbi:MAG: EpsI family protein [Gammaproteobacteria bacterium]
MVGNLVRAWLVVMMVHLSDGRLAGDHVTYGTLFYAAILLALFLVGARYADAPVKPDSPSPSLTAPRLTALPGVALAGSALASVLLVLATSAAPAALHSRMAGAGYAGLPPFPLSPDGYVGPSEAARDRQPSLRGPAGEHKARYQGGSGTRPVDVYVAIFDPARHTGELTESDNRVFDQRIWRQVAGQSRSGLDEAVLRPALGAPLPDGVSRFVWSWYVVNGEATNSRLQAKLLELKGMLSGRQAQQALIAFSTTFESSVNEEHSARARRDLMQFGRTYCAAAPLPCPALLGNQPQ